MCSDTYDVEKEYQRLLATTKLIIIILWYKVENLHNNLCM